MKIDRIWLRRIGYKVGYRERDFGVWRDDTISISELDTSAGVYNRQFLVLDTETKHLLGGPVRLFAQHALLLRRTMFKLNPDECLGIACNSVFDVSVYPTRSLQAMSLTLPASYIIMRCSSEIHVTMRNLNDESWKILVCVVESDARRAKGLRANICLFPADKLDIIDDRACKRSMIWIKYAYTQFHVFLHTGQFPTQPGPKVSCDRTVERVTAHFDGKRSCAVIVVVVDFVACPTSSVPVKVLALYSWFEQLILQ